LTETKSSQEFQALLDAAVDGIVVIDHRGVIQSFNRGAERMFGFNADEALGQNVSVLMADDDRRQHDGFLARYVESRVPHIVGRGREVTARRKDGTTFPAHLSVGAVVGVEPPRFVGFLHDVTARRRSETEAHQLQDRLMHVSRLATVGEMASGIAHELNQPLAAIATYAHACDRLLGVSDPDIPEVQSALRQIADQAIRAGDIIRRLRVLARNDSSPLGPLDLSAVVEELAGLITSDAKAHRVHYRLELARDLPMVMGDRAQLQQVVINLVRNALEALGTDATRSDASEVVVTTRSIPGDSVEIAVTDNGPGVDAKVADRIFDPFCTTKPAGTGLGLPISRTIIALHHGTLEYESNDPVGARFVARLPPIGSEPSQA
jgi:two-component system, LuxR family, sensor kinase FixL